MKERPIIFSATMVRALLDGRKTQTRRIVKFTDSGLVKMGTRIWHIEDPNAVLACPYGQPGDQLWVRETHRFEGLDPKIAIKARRMDEVIYRADVAGDRSCDDCAWRPSIFMRRWSSRINLEITGIRVERLNEISEDDANAEGVSGQRREDGDPYHDTDACEEYQALWNSINGSGSWAANPWVWVVEFKKVEGGQA